VRVCEGAREGRRGVRGQWLSHVVEQQQLAARLARKRVERRGLAAPRGRREDAHATAGLRCRREKHDPVPDLLTGSAFIDSNPAHHRYLPACGDSTRKDWRTWPFEALSASFLALFREGEPPAWFASRLERSAIINEQRDQSLPPFYPSFDR